MATAPEVSSGNRSLDILRRMSAEKRETKRQLREAFKTDPEFQRVIAELKERNAVKQASAV